MSEVKKGLFEELFGKNDVELEKARKPLIKSQLQRKFYAAYDACEGEIIDAQNKKSNNYGNYQNLNLNAIIGDNVTIENLERQKKMIVAEYEAFFGEPMQLRV